jgi:hypothetical protein
VGTGLVALAGWLARHDVAWRAAAQGGLPRFVAVALGSGYVWLGAAGVLALASPPSLHPVAYDPALHAVFLGFAFAMVFGHAPIIFPAILRVPVPFRPRFYAHLALLQLAVGLRFVADLALWDAGKRWGGILGAAAIAVFILNTATSRWPRGAEKDQRSV